MSAFPEINRIRYEGPKSDNPLAFRWYNPEELVEGKSMKEHLRFTVCYWHTFRGTGSDPFGGGTMLRPWDDGSESVANACSRAQVAFEFFEKLGVPYYAFHDRDVAPEGNSLTQSNANLDAVVKVLKEQQQRTGIKLLWGTANMFSNPRFMHGAATTCNVEVFAYAAAQVKKALEVTQELGGENYVFWGGREGYQNLFNTDMKRELDHLARFFHMAVDYAKEIGFKGQFLIEPKPKEPTKHQYDSDAAACLNFLRTYGLMDYFKLNIETNHATARRVPELQTRAIQAFHERQPVDGLELRTCVHAVLQPVVRDHAVQVMNVVQTDIAGEPVEHLGKIIKRRAEQRGDLEVPFSRMIPVRLFELVLDEKEPAAGCRCHDHDGEYDRQHFDRPKYVEQRAIEQRHGEVQCHNAFPRISRSQSVQPGRALDNEEVSRHAKREQE